MAKLVDKAKRIVNLDTIMKKCATGSSRDEYVAWTAGVSLRKLTVKTQGHLVKTGMSWMMVEEITMLRVSTGDCGYPMPLGQVHKGGRSCMEFRS